VKYRTGIKVIKSIVQIQLLGLIFGCLGCSSGGGNGTSTNSSPSKDKVGFDQIIVDELPRSIEVLEGESVKISARARGEGAEQVTYQWRLPDGVAFSGQNTSSIEFESPMLEGEELDVISVSLELGLKNGKLFGNTRRSTTVVVNSRDVPDYLKSGFTTRFSAVEQFDTDMISSGGVWRQRSYERKSSIVAGIKVVNQVKAQKIIYGEKGEDTFAVSVCGNPGKRAVEEYFESAVIDCEALATSVRRYQTGDSFRVEKYCRDDLVYASNLEKIRDSGAEDLGSIKFDVDDFEIFNDGVGVCGTYLQETASYVSEEVAGPVHLTNNLFLVHVPQEDNYIDFIFILSKGLGPFNWFPLSEDEEHSFIVVSDLTEELQFVNADRGSLRVELIGDPLNGNPKFPQHFDLFNGYSLEFELDYGSIFETKSIEGTIELGFE